jgi:lysophospholipase L1-like esterase
MLQEQLGARAVVINRGYPGDRAIDALPRWADDSSGDIAVIFYGANDADTRDASRRVSLDLYETALEAVIRRRLNHGAQVIVILPSPQSRKSTQPMIDPYRRVALAVAVRTHSAVLDPAEVLAGDPSPLRGDGIHLTDEAERAIARRLASMIDTVLPR